MNTRWAERYVGIPFVDGGRTIDGLDCWGLVRLMLKEECDIDVPSYGEISAEQLNLIAHKVANESALDPWVPVIRAERFDVAVMHRGKAPVHVGIMLDAEHMLHIERATDSVIVSPRADSVRFRAIKYFRHRELLQCSMNAS